MTTGATPVTDNVAETAAPPLEVETLRERLLTQVGSRVGGTRGSLSKCATKYRDFLSTVLTATHADSSVTDSIEVLKQDLEREVQLYQVEMHKVALMAGAARLEEEACDREHEELNKRVQDCQQDISELQHTWTLEKKKRRNREEYEALAKLANNRPPRRKLQEKLGLCAKGNRCACTGRGAKPRRNSGTGKAISALATMHV